MNGSYACKLSSLAAVIATYTKDKFVLRSIKQLYGEKLIALDGEIGEVKNLYFDRQTWAVRYLVAETGAWLTSRQVLLSPCALDRACPPGSGLAFNVTLKQIERSPLLEWHKPVSRRFEEEIHRYYGWPCYWWCKEPWDTSCVPVLEPPEEPLPNGRTAKVDAQYERTDAHLRRTRAVGGFHVQASDGIIGRVCDFMMEPQDWAIRQLLITTGRRLSDKEVMIPAKKVDRISDEEITVFVSSDGEADEQSHARDMALISAAD